MGETLPIDQGKPVLVSIRFRSPKLNNNGDRPRVRTVQLIMGDVKGKIDPGSPDYEKDTNESAVVIKQFTSAELKNENGWTEVSFKLLNLNKDSFLRIRGSNHDPDTEFETDTEGNPQPDSLAINLNIDGADEAWADLWFYSNPIFLDVK